ncbi:hypothetical protein [Chitinophaga varians]|uniref:hypothetical protein n=1 Tax=Chitinophaga varians TaxID=2202339 RepID=UPI00165EF4D4|nr:hypothetical protein [Chitinophaga varians]MBC9909377.1 hypothetical protein [Chitinophaga varians]
MKKCLYVLSAVAAVLLGACSKEKYGDGDAHGKVSFYNASYTLNAFLGASSSQQKVLLALTPDGKQSVPMAGSATPYFNACTDCGSRYDYPRVTARNTIPWVSFDYYTPGPYTVRLYLNSIDSAMQYTFPVNVTQDQSSTYALSDSLGAWHVTAVRHEAPATAGNIRLRLVQLCPDADSVNLRIGNRLLTGMQNLPYGAVSQTIDYPLAADSTLKLRLFNARDTLTTIARTDLPASPRQSYLLILRNYSKPHQYTDKQGRTVSIIAAGTLDTRKLE